MVDTLHPEYSAMLPSWQRARAIHAGEDAVKAGCETFLPKPGGLTADEYEAYKTRANFYNATARTTTGYIGMIFRRQPIVVYPQSQAIFPTFETDTDLLGTTLEGYAKQIANEVIQVARAGTLIEWNDTLDRPHCVHYRAEDIINWRTQPVRGKSRATLVVLREWVAVPGADDEFATEWQENYRVLRLLPQGRDGAPPPSAENSMAPEISGPPSAENWEYITELWTVDTDKETRERTPRKLTETKALRLGQTLQAIPFVFHGAKHNRAQPDKLPLEDLITVNLDHYRLDADYKHALHFTALPTAWAAGFGKEANLTLGSGRILMTEDPAAKLGYLEYFGHGLNSFEKAIERDEKLMAVLGARLLESQKRQAETAEALRIRQGGEESILQNIATTISDSITDVLRWVCWWTDRTPKEATPDKLPDKITTFRLNKDFGTNAINADDLKAIVESWQSKAFSQDTLLELLRRGEILPEGRTNAQEKQLLNKEPRKQGTEAER